MLKNCSISRPLCKQQFTQVTYLLTISMLKEYFYSKTAFVPPLPQHLLAKVTCRTLAASVHMRLQSHCS